MLFAPGEDLTPQPGDVALVEVTGTGRPGGRIWTDSGRAASMGAGDRAVVAFANRHVVDAFEGEVDGVEDISLLHGTGLIGTVTERHPQVTPPAAVRFLGFLHDLRGQRVNLKSLGLDAKSSITPPAPNGKPAVFLVIGTGGGSGQRTVISRVVGELQQDGVRVAYRRCTGSTPYEPGDQPPVGARELRDFSDYGYPTTYRCTQSELLQLFHRVVAEAAVHRPDVVLIELGDSLLQRETNMLLSAPEVRTRIQGVVLTATCSASALFGVQWTRQRGHRVVALSGLFTTAPLMVRELERWTNVPVVLSDGDGRQLVQLLNL